MQVLKIRRGGYFIAYRVRVTPGFPKDYDFGIKRPCLIVYESNRVIDVYPHQEEAPIPNVELARIATSPRLTVTVLDFLRELIKLC